MLYTTSVVFWEKYLRKWLNYQLLLLKAGYSPIITGDISDVYTVKIDRDNSRATLSIKHFDGECSVMKNASSAALQDLRSEMLNLGVRKERANRICKSVSNFHKWLAFYENNFDKLIANNQEKKKPTVVIAKKKNKNHC